MNEVVRLLKKEEQQLNNIVHQTEKSLEGAPDGILRISRSGNTMQYYKREDEKDRNGKYIRKKNMSLVYDLAQKEYDKAVRSVATYQKKKIDKFLKNYQPDAVKNIYEKLSEEHQLLTTPIIMPDEQYINRWRNRAYEGKEFWENTSEIYTDNGERVRSKSEKMLADKLKMMGIPYLYEYPLYLNDYGYIYPDFTMLNVRTREEYYLEHFGMMDDAYYSEGAVKKIESYERNGYFRVKS